MRKSFYLKRDLETCDGFVAKIKEQQRVFNSAAANKLERVEADRAVLSRLDARVASHTEL